MLSRSTDRDRRCETAFTLVELLVVVSIITVLVALIIPSMEEAVYQAKLAACASNMKVVATAATTYAQDNQQFYPKRNEAYDWDALMIRSQNWGGFDLRPKFQPYMTLPSFNDPLLGGLDFSDSANEPDAQLFCNFNIYTGLPRGDASQSVMNRVGERFEFTDTLSEPGVEREYRFSVLACDRDMNWNWSAASHPDRIGFIFRQVYQNDPRWNPPMTLAQWGRWGKKSRPVDLNYAYEDLSVRRYDGVTRDDERMAKVSATNRDEYLRLRFEHLPRQ